MAVTDLPTDDPPEPGPADPKAGSMSLADDPTDTEADEKPSGMAAAEPVPAASVVNRTLREGVSAASALGERVSKTASAVTPLATEVRKTTEAVGKNHGQHRPDGQEHLTGDSGSPHHRPGPVHPGTVGRVRVHGGDHGLPHLRDRVSGPPVRHSPLGARGGNHRLHRPRPPSQRSAAAKLSELCLRLTSAKPESEHHVPDRRPTRSSSRPSRRRAGQRVASSPDQGEAAVAGSGGAPSDGGRL